MQQIHGIILSQSVLRQPDQKLKIVQRADSDLLIDEKRSLQDTVIADIEKPGTYSRIESSQILEHPDPPDSTFYPNNLREKDCFAEERVMATQLKTTGQTTSTNAMNPMCEIFAHLKAETAIECEYSQKDETIHWEPPDLRGSKKNHLPQE